jgi:hypothetical protein
MRIISNSEINQLLIDLAANDGDILFDWDPADLIQLEMFAKNLTQVAAQVIQDQISVDTDWAASEREKQSTAAQEHPQ